jgi:hypothetical protein
MPAKDLYHDAVRTALFRDGWTITHDPFTLTFGLRDVFVDLSAERPLAAEKEGRRIAVEVKSFLGPSELHQFEGALGQYVFYRSLLRRVEPDRKLYLAVPERVVANTLSEPIAQPALEDLDVAIVVFHPQNEVIVRWIR